MDQALNQKIDAFIAANKEQMLAGHCSPRCHQQRGGGARRRALPTAWAPVQPWIRPWSWRQAWALPPATVKITSAMPSWRARTRKSIWQPSAMWTWCPRAMAGRQTPLPCRSRTTSMIGRGVADDKGPMVATLYALKFLKEEGVLPALSHPRPRRRQRRDPHARCGLLSGALPSSRSSALPRMRSSRSATAKKASSTASWSARCATARCKEFVGGVANNAVPDRASALVETDITKLKQCPQHHAGAGGQRRPYPRLGQERPRRHAGGHRECHWAGGRTTCWTITSAMTPSAST